jgi:hypothetical protein
MTSKRRTKTMATWAKWEEELETLEDRELFDLQKHLEGAMRWRFLPQEFEGMGFVKKLVDIAVMRRLERAVDALIMKSLNDVSEMYRNGDLSEEVTQAYIVEWNKGPHFTMAVLKDGGIRNVNK